MSVPNLFSRSEPRAQQILIKFHWQVFERMRKRFIRPGITSNGLSSNALWVELSKIDNQVLIKKQGDATDELEYAGLYSNVGSRVLFLLHWVSNSKSINGMWNQYHWTKVPTKLNPDLLQQNLFFFPIMLFGNQWSHFVAIALLCIGKNNTFTPMLCYFDPAGNNGTKMW